MCFAKKIGCEHTDFHLLGDVTLINTDVKIGKNVTIYPGVMFWGDGQIIIGDNVDIGKDTVIYASKQGGISIGNNTRIAAQCYIIDMDHGVSLSDRQDTVEAVRIGQRVWIAAGCKILKGTVIEDDAVIGAQAVVKGHIDKNAIAVGIPARAIRHKL